MNLCCVERSTKHVTSNSFFCLQVVLGTLVIKPHFFFRKIKQNELMDPDSQFLCMPFLSVRESCTLSKLIIFVLPLKSFPQHTLNSQTLVHCFLDSPLSEHLGEMVSSQNSLKYFFIFFVSLMCL